MKYIDFSCYKFDETTLLSKCFMNVSLLFISADTAYTMLAPDKVNFSANDARSGVTGIIGIPNSEQNKFENRTITEEVTPQKMILKVPEFKRTLTTVVQNRITNVDAKMMIKKETVVSQNENDYKMSINKLYQCNPKGTPKYMCNQCQYACDTLPKMKHHQFRHKPQRYKCPYCNYRKYPR